MRQVICWYKKDKKFVNILEDNIHAQGETSELISDRDQYKVGNSAHIIIWSVFIDDLAK